MKIEVKKIEANKREISIVAAEEEVRNKFDDVFKKIGLQAKVPGFRPGHAPRDILQKHYSAQVKEQVIRELVPDIYSRAVSQEGLEVIEMPEIFDVKLEKDNLSFKARVELSPEVPLNDYKGIKVEYKKLSVAQEELKRSIDAIKESRKMDSWDDDNAKGLGYPNLAELEAVLEKQIFMQKEKEQRQKIENTIIQALTKGADFKLPRSMVQRQTLELLRQAKLDLALRGIEREKIEEQEKKLFEELTPEAERQVRIYLILSSIAKKENIPQDENMSRRVMEFLFRQAQWQEVV